MSSKISLFQNHPCLTAKYKNFESAERVYIALLKRVQRLNRYSKDFKDLSKSLGKDTVDPRLSDLCCEADIDVINRFAQAQRPRGRIMWE